MPTYLPHSNRRFRYPLGYSGANVRRAIGVRWPFSPKGANYFGGLPGTPQPWGLDCPRSPICLRGNAGIEGTTFAPTYDNPPSNTRQYSRRLLTQKNSVRDVLFWRHTHVWNWWKNDDPAEFAGFRLDRAYWDWVSDFENVGYPHVPRLAEDTNYPSPFPMSGASKWIVRLNTGTNVGSAPDDKWIFDIRVFSNPEPISNGTISWDYQDYSEHKASLNRSCTRYIYFKDCFVSENKIFLPEKTYFLVREIDPSLLMNPASPAYNREKNDLRFLPFGLTDCQCAIPGDILDHSLLSGTLKNEYFEMEKYPTGVGPYDPPPPYDEASADGEFSSDDVFRLDGDMLYSAMNYLATPYWLQDPVPGACTMIPSEQLFDLFMKVDFYKFKLYNWANYDGSTSFRGKLVEERFGGAYGDCYAIF